MADYDITFRGRPDSRQFLRYAQRIRWFAVISGRSSR